MVFNVCGKRFESNVSVIQAQPDALLAMLLRHQVEPPPPQGAGVPNIFIQRDPKMFRWILYWYSTGGLLVEHDTVGVPKEVWDAEIDFYTLFTKQEAEVVEQKRKLPVIDESHELAALAKKVAMEVNDEVEKARAKRRETYKAMLEYMIPDINTKEGAWTGFTFIGRASHHKPIHWSWVYPDKFRNLDLEDLRSHFAELKEYANAIGFDVRDTEWRPSAVYKKHRFTPASEMPINTAHQSWQIGISLIKTK